MDQAPASKGTVMMHLMSLSIAGMNLAVIHGPSEDGGEVRQGHWKPEGESKKVPCLHACLPLDFHAALLVA